MSIVINVLLSILSIYLFLLCRYYKKLAYSDFQTGLKNERYLNKYLNKRSEQTDAIAVLDIDLFKRLNEKYGYETVDELLKMIVSKFSRIINSKECLLIRYKQGDEFIFLFMNTSESPLKTLYRIQNEATSKFEILRNSKINLSYTIGYSSNNKSKDSRLILELANKALRYGKENKKGSIIYAQSQKNAEPKFKYC